MLRLVVAMPFWSISNISNWVLFNLHASQFWSCWICGNKKKVHHSSKLPRFSELDSHWSPSSLMKFPTFSAPRPPFSPSEPGRSLPSPRCCQGKQPWVEVFLFFFGSQAWRNSPPQIDDSTDWKDLWINGGCNNITIYNMWPTKMGAWHDFYGN